MALIVDPSARLSLVRSELRKIPGKRREGQGFTMIQCPFHPDSTPSGQVKHRLSRPRSIGFFNCRGCGIELGWNEFASRLGLEAFHLPPEADAPSIDQSAFNEACFAEDEELKALPYKLYPLNAAAADRLELPTTEWRGFDFEFLTSIGASLMYQEDTRRFYVHLPIFINGSLKGYIRALPKKPDDVSMPSYLNAPGSWSKTSGLFPYDAGVRLMRRKNLSTIVLVEGPRDAMRLIRDGVPALAILGTHSWTNAKIRLLELSGAESIILMTDEDRAGRKARKFLYSGEVMKEDGTVERVTMPLTDAFSVSAFSLKPYAERGKKLDPFEAPSRAIADLIEFLE